MLLYVDGFDWCSVNSQFNERWSYVVTNPVLLTGANTRFNYGTALLVNTTNGYYRSIKPNVQTWIVGMSVNFQAASASAGCGIFRISDGTTNQITVMINGSGYIEVRRGNQAGTVLATSSTPMPIDTWVYVEAKVYIHDSQGSVLLKIDGTEYISVTDADTKNSVNAYADRLYFGAQASTGALIYFDDLYVCDDTGSYNNDFLGDCRIETLFPDEAGSSTQWTPSAGSNYENVDDAGSNDGDSTYNSSSTADQVDLYGMAELTATPVAIHGIQEAIVARKDDAGSRSVRVMLRSDGTNYDNGSDLSLSDSFAHLVMPPRERDPSGEAWVKATVNALEAGVKLVS